MNIRLGIGQKITFGQDSIKRLGQDCYLTVNHGKRYYFSELKEAAYAIGVSYIQVSDAIASQEWPPTDYYLTNYR